MGWLVGGIGAFITAALGAPIAGAVISSGGSGRSTLEVSLGELDRFPVGRPALAQFTVTRVDGWVSTEEGRSVWVLRESDGTVTVFNGRCTHLGCAYAWSTEGEHKDTFVCPCHDGVFARDGRVVDGPPPRPLDILPATIESGTLKITYEDFQPGIPEKQPA